MSDTDTVAALRAAVLAAPADRTVRLVLADALDESGDAPRAEFVRAQVELERLSAADPRRADLLARCADLFREHWIDWWAPVCAAVGLPPPHVPGTGLRARLVRRLRTQPERGAPYHADGPACTVQVPNPQLSAQFVAGFPELLYFVGEPPRDLGRWAAAVPLNRLRWVGTAEDNDDWNALDHPALARLSELMVERLPLGAAVRVARFAPLAGLSRLSIGPTNPMPGAVVAAVRNPVWAQLRALDLLHAADPHALRALAEQGTLEHLEELSFGIAEVPAVQVLPGVSGALGTVIGAMFAALYASPPVPPAPVTGAEYSWALSALAQSPVAPRLKRLLVRDADLSWPNRAARALVRALPADTAGPFLTDACAAELALGLNPDRLELLQLPHARLSARARAALEARFGARLVLA